MRGGHAEKKREKMTCIVGLIEIALEAASEFSTGVRPPFEIIKTKREEK